MALDAEGRPWAWGSDEAGELGDGTPTPGPQAEPTRPAVELVRSIAAGTHVSGAVRADGTVATWGAKELGELGDGRAPEASAVPVDVPTCP